MTYTNTFYFQRLIQIGGIETFLYNIAKKYGAEKDITIFYSEADIYQLERIERYTRCIKYTGQKVKTKRAFFNYNIDPINSFEADEYIQIVHGDYKALGVRAQTHPKITRYIAVSKHVAEQFKALTGFDCEVSYNPVAETKPRKVLRLISATRLSSEKGGDRMIKLADELKAKDIPFTWDVYTNIKHDFGSVFSMREPTLDIIDYIADADYLVQLSDSEGYGYSVVEALTVGTPVIVTDLPVFKEIGVNKSNGFMLPLDMSDIPTEAIYKGLPEFTYKAKADKWGKLLGSEKSTYEAEKKSTVEVRATQDYFDMEMGRMVTRGEEYEVPYMRALKLMKYNVAERR